MNAANQDPLWLTAQAVVGWLDRNIELISGLAALRRLGAEADEAVEAVLAVPAITKLRLSLELFSLLTTGSGADPRALLRAAGSAAHVRVLDEALYGHGLQLVPSR